VTFAPVSWLANLTFIPNYAAFVLKLAIAVLPSAKSTTMTTAAVVLSLVAVVLSPAARWLQRWHKVTS